MKLRSVFATLAFGTAVGLITAPTHAQNAVACTLYMCMAGISGVGASGGPGCIPSLALWNAPTPAGLAVYDESGFDGLASYGVRESYLMTMCPTANVGTNAAILQTIMLMWGTSLVPM
ncbi:hypothetical protein [Rhodanobacter sp. MP1X3]|uniref:hypothetical protein n=1 Tax=Rhodanobacter sp. MP1X3 TaxID=2723086 RepID=UPI00161CFA1D|nr:hypothetical protein [Rhodanobacter sp. MP1X3]MBB6241386.1 hypothetical protein [Rhodanobacter sp. MP1X3]